MFFKTICLCSLISLAVVNCEPPSAQYGTPLSSYGTPNYNTHNNNQEYSAPKSYEFGYQVKDDYTGNNYKRQEASDGNQVNGEYRVQLPDGRIQIVTYYADWQSGFHADVRYEGTASYPENYGNGGHHGGFGGPGYGNGNGFGGAGYNNLHHGGQVSNQYGAPAYNGLNGNGNYNGANSPATSSVSIKDYSGPGTPYSTGGGGHGGYGNGNHLNGGFNFGNGGFDSYANAGSFGSKVRPSAAYGAP